MHPVNKPFNKLTLDLIRHGEPEGGVMYRGSQDDPLSATGWEQMRLSVARAQADGQGWDRIISSPMQRCRAFATWLAETHKLPLHFSDDLREMHFGDLEGLRPEDAWNAHPELLKAIWNAPEEHTAPNGEPFNEFVDRVARSLWQIIHAHDSERLLIVAHGGVVRAALRKFLHMNGADTFRIEVPYAGITRLQVFKQEGEAPQIALAFINGYRGT